MDTRTTLLVAAALWALFSFGGDLWGLAGMLGSKVAAIFGRRGASPAALEEIKGELIQTLPEPPINAEVAAFMLIAPRMSPIQATAAWARLEPQGDRRKEDSP